MRSLKMKSLVALLACMGIGAYGQAGAQSNGVTIYGFLKVDVEQVSAKGNSINRLANDLSVLGFRAREDLGDGLSVWAQIETNVRVDTGEGPWGGRNTGIGLKGNAGELMLGQWELPMRFVSVYAVDPFTAGIFASNGIMGNGFSPGAANGKEAQSFDRRQPNLIQYLSPELSGFKARLAYAPSEEKNEQTAPDLLSAMFSYTQGPLYAAYGYELHREYFGKQSADSAHRIGAAYSIGPTRVRFAWERLRYEPTANTHLARDAWQLAVTHDIGAGQLRASYVSAQASKGNSLIGVGAIGRAGSDSAAAQVSLGYGYTLSKRTEIWGAYTKISNGTDAGYNLSANAFPGLKPGHDPRGLGLGITHKF